jgi:hypothetical protein
MLHCTLLLRLFSTQRYRIYGFMLALLSSSAAIVAAVVTAVVVAALSMQYDCGSAYSTDAGSNHSTASWWYYIILVQHLLHLHSIVHTTCVHTVRKLCTVLQTQSASEQ